MKFPKKDHYTTDKLYKMANEMREDLIKMLTLAGSGHSAGPLGTMEIWTAMYFHILNHKPQDPDWKDRDRLILSCGHICPARYTVMAHAGYLPHEELWTLRKWGTRLQGHPERTKLPGVETTSGPLGSGLSQAAGMALAGKMDEAKWRVYCIMSDGEQQAGNTWEAAMFAGKNNLNNLTAIMDRNNIQINGHTEDVMPLEPLEEKYKSFGWHVLHIDGHNIEEFIDAVNHAKAVYEDPTLIIAHTIPGRGVGFMEWDPAWHGKPPKPEEARKALHEIRTLGGKIRSEHE
ncbi:transketolase [Candidatus Saccharibacteria bacterium]|nr:transketolase [Candidatus Saccharibacteria bacterium]